jgi:prepilin-type N-terminal cleavage/methylation domain-containing protein
MSTSSTSKYFQIFSSKMHNKGFTLTELLVVISIATILLTAMVFQQNKWNDKLAVNTQIYELGLFLRQAQVYGLGVKEYAVGAGDKFDKAYGVHINMSTPDRYYFFVDADKDGVFDAGEVLETKILTRGVTINRICGRVSGVQSCSNSGALSQLSATFLRPEPKANIRFLNNGGNDLPTYGAPAEIYFRSRNGTENYVQINSNGYISISQ